MCWCFVIMILKKIFYPSLTFRCKVSFFVMSEAIYSKDKVFDLWCSEVDWVGKEFRSRSKGEGEWGLSDKQALIEKDKQQNNSLWADFLKIENQYVSFKYSHICHRGACQCHICPWETFISLRLSYTTTCNTVLCYIYTLIAKWPSCSRRSSSFCAKSSLCHLVIK